MKAISLIKEKCGFYIRRVICCFRAFRDNIFYKKLGWAVLNIITFSFLIWIYESYKLVITVLIINTFLQDMKNDIDTDLANERDKLYRELIKRGNGI